MPGKIKPFTAAGKSLYDESTFHLLPQWGEG
jgi:hypothetical protein